MNKRILGAVLISLALSGCVNGFAKYYEGAPDARVIPNYDSSFTPGNKIPVYSTSDVEGDIQKMMERGYVVIGHSSFYGPDNQVNAAQLQNQANKIGAHAVLFHSRYRDTVSGAVPITTPNNSTSYTTGTATAYGSGGYATATGNAVTNTYGTTTTYVPYTQSRSDFEAVYFAKVRIVTGLFVVPLTDVERQELQTNLALRVKAVVQDSPAFLADILPGDYVLAINDEGVSSIPTWKAAVEKYQGQDVSLRLLRNRQSLTKKVHFNLVGGADTRSPQ